MLRTGKVFGTFGPGELAVFLSGEALRKSADDDYPFYANRNFVYLTGIEQRDSILVLYRDGGSLSRSCLFLRQMRLRRDGTGRGLSRRMRRQSLV